MGPPTRALGPPTHGVRTGGGGWDEPCAEPLSRGRVAGKGDAPNADGKGGEEVPCGKE